MEGEIMDLIDFNIKRGELFAENEVEQKIDVIQPVISPQTEEAMWVTAEEMAKAREAQIKTAEYSSEIVRKIDVVISNQNDYIDILKKNYQEIIDILHNLFASGEDSVSVQKEIWKILQDQNPNKDLLKDKSFDMVIQMIFGAISIYLRSKGIEF